MTHTLDYLQITTAFFVLVTTTLTAFNTVRAALLAARVKVVTNKIEEVHTLVNSTNTRLEATALLDKATIQTQSVALAAATERLIAQGSKEPIVKTPPPEVPTP